MENLENDDWIGEYMKLKSHAFLKNLYENMGIDKDPAVISFLNHKKMLEMI